MKIFVLTFCLLGCLGAEAQTCTGGLGPPIVNIDFGQGTSIGQPLANGITNLTFVNNFCPNDGQYTITDYTSGCYGGTWLVTGEDHTRNQAGRFMLINASYQPSDFYVQTVNGLCQGTSYQFAAWIANMSTYPGQILPNITFRIEKTDGTVLASYGTGDVPHANPFIWDQYAFYFTTPAGVSSLVLRMTNNAPGGIGNDLALDDITFRAAGPLVQLAVAGYPSDTITVCDYNQQVMTVNATVESCYPSEDVQWQQSNDTGTTWKDIPGANTTTYVRPATATGIYLYRLVVAQTGNLGTSGCEVFSNPLVVDIVKKPSPAVAIASSQATACLGLPITFTASPTDGGGEPAYQWMLNGAPVGTDSTGYTTSALVNGELVSCVMTSDAACALPAVVPSNVLNLSVVPVPVQALSIAAPASNICQDSVVQFTAVPTNGGSDPAYQWQVDGAKAGVGAVFTDGALNNGDLVNCIMTGSLVCSQPVSSSNVVTMTVYPLPVITLDSAVVIAGGASVQLMPSVTGDVVSWTWSPAAGLDNALTADPIASPVGTTPYQLYVVTSDGCHSTATEVVAVYYPLLMPGAFTPNGDGRNDVFRVPPSFPVTIHYFAVYNRQGTRVFYSVNVGTGWDGNLNGHAQPSGAYVWELVFENPLTKKTEQRRGTVVLVR